MRTIVGGYRRDYGEAAADSHCAAQLMITGLTDCGHSTPTTPEDGTLLGACSTANGICVEHYANPNVPGANGTATCAINAGTWRPSMACPKQDLLGYCEDNLAEYGQTFYYYRNSANDEKRLRAACDTGWHANEASAGAGGMTGGAGGASGGGGKASATGGKASATGGAASSAACEAITAFNKQISDAAKADLSGKFNECESVADCEERGDVTVKCPNGLSVWLGIRPIARSSGDDFDAALEALANEHCGSAPEPATCGGGGIIGAHHLECTEQQCVFVFP
jgi:hypothetical protein